MNEVEYEHGEEMKARGVTAAANLKAILGDHENVASLARAAYKYTSCGASLGVALYAGEDNRPRWVYGDALREIKPDDFICALSVSSIVEGVEQCTETIIIDLFDEAHETPEHAANAYAAALDATENEATSIWNETHGCETCGEHFGRDCGHDSGFTPVWPDCPACEGNGVVI